MLKIGSVYCELKRKFDSWSNNACPLPEGIAVSSDTTVLHGDEVWTSLIETDVLVQELLQRLSFSITTQRVLIDHLPGGKYYSVTGASVVQETASVPITNVAQEVLDRLSQMLLLLL